MMYKKPAIITVEAQDPEPVPPAFDGRVRLLTDRISQSRGNAQVTLIQLSSQVGLTPSHVGRCFKQQLGIGFRTFSTLKRDEYVRELLRETALPIKEIAARAGYMQVCDLNHTFRRLHGVSPTQYRTQIRRASVLR